MNSVHSQDYVHRKARSGTLTKVLCFRMLRWYYAWSSALLLKQSQAQQFMTTEYVATWLLHIWVSQVSQIKHMIFFCSATFSNFLQSILWISLLVFFQVGKNGTVQTASNISVHKILCIKKYIFFPHRKAKKEGIVCGFFTLEYWWQILYS